MPNRSARPALVSWATQSHPEESCCRAPRQIRCATPASTAGSQSERRTAGSARSSNSRLRSRAPSRVQRIAQLQSDWNILRIRFMNSRGQIDRRQGSLGAPDSPESATVATRWSNLNSLRHAMVFAAWLAALKAFAIFHQQRGRPPVARNTRTDSTAQRLGSALIPRAAKGRVSSRRSAPAALHRAD